MDNGVVVERGSHDELVQMEGGVYNRLWNMQLRQQVGDYLTEAISLGVWRVIRQ